MSAPRHRYRGRRRLVALLPTGLLALVASAFACACSGDDTDDSVATARPTAPMGTPAPMVPDSAGASTTGGGTADRPRSPAPVDAVWVVVAGEGQPVSVEVRGQLPTPCHEVAWSVGAPDDEGRIAVELWSEADPDVMCAQVLSPFSANVPLGDLPAGDYVAVVGGTEAPFTQR